MTKDWDIVQDEIRELSFTQKKPLEEVKELMERKYKFHASTRAYRMKLKEWGFMRHRPRKSTSNKKDTKEAEQIDEYGTRSDDDLSSTIVLGPMSIEPDVPAADDIASLPHQDRPGGILIVPEDDVIAEPTFMGLLRRDRDLMPRDDPWPQTSAGASGIVMDMLGAILDNDSQKLEALTVRHMDHINDPIGLPFDTPGSRFHDHPALNHMVIMQHPNQTLFDIACGMPCGPIIWVMLSHGATGSKHPLGQDLALHNAIKNDRPYTVQALLVPGRSNVNGEPGTTWKPLLQAIFWNKPDIARILLDRGADVNATGPSPQQSGEFTALQLCLQRRIDFHANTLLPQNRTRCTAALKILLECGANIYTPATSDAALSPFAMFLKPWEHQLSWFRDLSVDDLDCLRLFLAKGASLEASFDCFPCSSNRCKSFEHQALWHSTPHMARFVIDNFVKHPNNDGSSLLHEILGHDPDAKRHPADTLRDIEVLVRKGVSPDAVDTEGLTPLMRCLEQCPAVDLVARLQMLIDRGADAELVDADGDLPYVHAARSLEEPLLTEVMQVLVSRIRGRYVALIDNVPHSWSQGSFPIAETPTYEKVMSCTRQTGDFKRDLCLMIPEDVQSTFQRAYFSLVSKNYLDTMTRVAKSKFLDAREKQGIIEIVTMRKDIDLPEYRFDQEFVIALLDPQPVASLLLQNVDMTMNIEVDLSNLPSTSTTMSYASPSTIAADIPPSPPSRSWQFNPNGNPATKNTSSSATSPSEPTNSFLDLAFTDIGTTTITWRPPKSNLHKAVDVKKAEATVLQYRCGACADGVIMNRGELGQHEVEHAHTAKCKDETCRRRFCAPRNKEKEPACQDHLFGGM